MAPRGNLNPLEPSHEVVLENHFHKFPRRAGQVVIDLKTMNWLWLKIRQKWYPCQGNFSLLPVAEIVPNPYPPNFPPKVHGCYRYLKLFAARKAQAYSEAFGKGFLANPCDFRILKNHQVTCRRKSKNDRIWDFSTASAAIRTTSARSPEPQSCFDQEAENKPDEPCSGY
jgi:hypothetical protein